MLVLGKRRQPTCKVGFWQRLPSVAPGQMPADVIASGAVPVVRPTGVFR
jgi:hypothetical protein